jgi:hypothetical protein
MVIDPDGPQASYRRQPSINVLNALEELLRGRWSAANRDGIPYRSDDEIMSIEVVPAFKRQGSGYFIPDPVAGVWIATNPKHHHELSSAKNTDCGGKYIRSAR